MIKKLTYCLFFFIPLFLLQRALADAVMSIDIQSSQNSTSLILELESPITLTVSQNPSLDKITLHLPKATWKNVHQKRPFGGFIRSYKVDQSNPEVTELILDVRPGTVVASKQNLPAPDGHGSIMLVNFSRIPPPKEAEDVTLNSTKKLPSCPALGPCPSCSLPGGPDSPCGPSTYFFGGIFTGIGQGHALRSIYEPNAATPFLEQDKGFLGPLFGLSVGIGIDTKSFYFGLELSSNLPNLIGINTHPAPSNNTVYAEYTTEIKKIFMGSLVWGYHPFYNTTFYMRGGLDFVPTASKVRYTSAGEYRKNASGFHAGLGIETDISPSTSLYVESRHHMLGKVSRPNTNFVTYNIQNGSQRLRLGITEILAGIKFKSEKKHIEPVEAKNILSGTYLGLSVGGLQLTTQKKIFAYMPSTIATTGRDRIVSNFSILEDATPLAPYGEFFLGGQIRFNKLILSLEGSAGYSRAKQELKSGSTALATDTFTYNVFVGPRIGYNFNQNSIFYFKTGLVLTHLKHTAQPETLSSTHALSSMRPSATTFKGIGIGFGADTFIMPKWLIRFEVLSEIFGSKYIGQKNNTILFERIKPQAVRIKIGTGYVF